MDVADDGTVPVSYYDFRNNTSAPGALTDAWVVHCHPQRSDCAALASWEETRVSPASFDISKAANARGYFLGDYQGLAHAGGRVFSLFAEAVSESDPSTIAFSRLGP